MLFFLKCQNITKTVSTIVVPIASEGTGNASARRAAKVGWTASRCGAILVLVGIVQAVIISVTDPGFGNASLIVAGEIPGIGAGLNRGFSGRIRIARFSVPVQFFAVRTSTLGFDSDIRAVIRDGKAEFLAASILVVARMFVDDNLRLPNN